MLLTSCAQGAVWSAKLNQAATLAVTGSADFTAKLWDAMTGDLLQTWEHRHIVKTVDFSRVRPRPHPARYTAARASPGCASRQCTQDAARVATGGKEKKVRVFSVEDRRAEPELELPHDDVSPPFACSSRCPWLISVHLREQAILKVLWLPDGNGLLTGTENGKLRYAHRVLAPLPVH